MDTGRSPDRVNQIAEAGGQFAVTNPDTCERAGALPRALAAEAPSGCRVRAPWAGDGLHGAPCCRWPAPAACGSATLAVSDRPRGSGVRVVGRPDSAA